MNLPALLASAAIGYLLGSIPFGLLFTRLFKGIDVRSGGSGHTGALNTWRLAGLFPAVLTVFGDMGKAVLAIMIAERLDPSGWAVVAAGIMVLVGHCWPIFAGFRGGVGMASGIAILLYLVPVSVLILIPLWAIFVALFRHFPRSQAAIAAVTPFVLWGLRIYGAEISIPLLVFGFLAGGTIFIRHLHSMGRTTFTMGLK